MAINILEKSVAELIAAGEVIERPASIVKEMVENSIDAGCTAITVEIRRGGISYIRVTDNGCGMSRDDLPKAFLRHATSKVLSVDDLNNINTLGFRGEALASVSAVARVDATSKLKSADIGYCLRLEGDVTISFDEVGCPNGTSIIVRDLFYNVPARLKFMKKDATEANVIAGIIDKLALSHPNISMKLISDFKVKLLTPGNGEMLSVIHTVFGKEFATALVPVNYEYNDVKVTGYSSGANSSRSNRSMQHFFVNGRYVKSKTCMAAIDEGYKNSVMVGKFPFCVLNVEMRPSELDVNVHPAKIEVRFVNERSIFDAIYFAVKSAAAAKDELTAVVKINTAPIVFKDDDSPQQILEVQSAPSPVAKQAVDKPATAAPSTAVSSPNSVYKAESQYSYISSDSLVKKDKPKPIIKLESPEIEPVVEPTVPISVRVIGELFKTYILFEAGESFVMMDKHAAHERILYEKLKRSVSLSECQVLLKPMTVTLSSEERTALSDNCELVEQMGFLIEDFGSNTVVIREVPLILADSNLEDILLDIATKFIELKRDVTADALESVLHSIACRAAIKANDFTGEREMRELVNQVIADETIRHCPHGRPIATLFKRNEIEKRFGRIG